MAGRKSSKGRKTTKTSGQSKAGIWFGTGRTNRALREGRFADRYSAATGVFMAGVLQYLTTEIFDLAVDVKNSLNKSNTRSRLTPRMLTLAIRRDEELNKLFAMTQISQGGILPNINEKLLKGKKAGATQEM